MRSRCTASQRQGFSLAESLIAIAIVSFTLLTIIGMMPPGLEHLRQAEERAARSRIISSLVGELESLEWSEIQRQAAAWMGPYYFDRQGLPTNARLEMVYVAQVRFSAGASPSEQLPGSNPSPYLRGAEIRVSDKAQGDNPFGGVAPMDYEIRTVLLSNNDAAFGRIDPTPPTPNP